MNPIADSLMDAVLSAVPTAIENPGDYHDATGILYCGKCHAPKQALIKLFPTDDAGGRMVPVACLCEQAEAAEQRAKDLIQQRIEANSRKLDALRSIGAASIPSVTFAQNDGQDQKTTGILMRYVNHFDDAIAGNMGLMLYGASGNGKTFFAECVAQELSRRGFYVCMTNIRSLVSAMGFDNAERLLVMQMVRSADLLILDDFGVERNTEYMNEQVYEIINERYRSAKPLMITTNLQADEMRIATDPGWKRICERVLEMCTPIRVEGGTRRKAIAMQKRDQLKRILNL